MSEITEAMDSMDGVRPIFPFYHINGYFIYSFDPQNLNLTTILTYSTAQQAINYFKALESGNEIPHCIPYSLQTPERILFDDDSILPISQRYTGFFITLL